MLATSASVEKQWFISSFLLLVFVHRRYCRTIRLNMRLVKALVKDEYIVNLRLTFVFFPPYCNIY